MSTIKSSSVDYNRLLPGVYVVQKHTLGNVTLMTFDIRMKAPNREPVMNTAEIHTIEHLGNHFLKNNKKYKDKVIFFGPMGCRTGFNLIIAENLDSKEIIPLLIKMFRFISSYSEEIPGATSNACGNYLDQNLPMAKFVSDVFLQKTLLEISSNTLYYPE